MFHIEPWMNAAGRLSTAEKSLQLLLTKDEIEAAALADFLDKQNRARQEIEKQVLFAAEEQISREFDPMRDAAIVVGAREWHAGVLGIVASRISRKYHRPAIVIGFDANGIGKGSGRSIEGLNLVEALNRCSGALQKFGGHKMAAGLTMQEKDIDLFSKDFRYAARELLSDEDLSAAANLRIDHELAFSELNGDFLHWPKCSSHSARKSDAAFLRAKSSYRAAAGDKGEASYFASRSNHHRRGLLRFGKDAAAARAYCISDPSG
jgi:single-stranded-DNA-specific exonuclease